MIASRCIWEYEWIYWSKSNGARDRMEGGFNARMGVVIPSKELKQLPSDHQSHSSIKSTRIPIYNGKRLF
ncbi:uncharacterized protein G2W53_004352 [Senna tora]|uniref:Uncharacterized protein n=1 Tax=Senna tora TaxID=362788 RepID=A0A835CH74_9FABA|nr:uncharacterized protein G2W53_004352 [Senna tora]